MIKVLIGYTSLYDDIKIFYIFFERPILVNEFISSSVFRCLFHKMAVEYRNELFPNVLVRI